MELVSDHHFIDISKLDKHIPDSIKIFLIDTLNQKDIKNTILKSQLNSMKTNKQNVFIICDGKIIKPTIFSKKKQNTKFIYNPKQLSKKCYGNPHIIHFHGSNLSIPSKNDILTHQFLFENGFQSGTIIGINEIHVSTPYKSFEVQWDKDFYKTISKDFEIINNIQSINCKKVRKKTFYCKIMQTNGTEIKKVVNTAIYQKNYKNNEKEEFTIDKNVKEISVNYTNILHGKCIIIKNKKDIHMTCFS